jgi:hypothetical protein
MIGTIFLTLTPLTAIASPLGATVVTVVRARIMSGARIHFATAQIEGPVTKILVCNGLIEFE